MKMKSNQRREAEQVDRSKVLWDPLRKLVGIQAEDGEGGSNVSYNLLTQSSYLNKQQAVVGISKSTNRIGANNEYCAIINNKRNNKYSTVDQLELPLPSSSSININNNANYSTQRMYNITRKQSESNKQRASVRLARRRPRQTTSATRILNESLSSIYRQTLIFVVISLTLSSCILINQIQALSTSSAADSAESSLASSSSQPAQAPSTSVSSSSSSALSPSLASSVASSALSSLSSAIISAALQDGKSSSSDRSANPQANSGSEVAPSPTLSNGSSLSSLSSSASAPASLASSLSSAVVSAAAAAAVAAAQNSLSGGDARSLITGSSPMMLASNTHHTGNHNHLKHNHHQQSRNPGLHLAMKLADAIPEVPYNILHNMKKLDHAAPFYNVGNKVSYSGNSKESSHGLLSSVLHASGGFGGAAEQLSQLFRSPLWKRIADGYGDFASEFRSLFRAPSTTTMKGPTKPSSKLLRDLSVPALLMILASTIPGDWRPVRTRRKSLTASDLASSAYPLVDPMIASASSELPNYSVSPRLYGSMPNFNMALPQQERVTPQQQIGREMNPLAQMYNHFDQSAASSSSSSNQARINNINPQQSDSGASTIAWLQPPQSELTNQMHNYDTQLHQIQLQQHPQQLIHPQQPSIKRFGDSLLSALSFSPASDSTKSQLIHSDSKPVDGDHTYSNNLAASSVAAPSSNPLQSSSPGSLFSSLTSSLANQVGHGRLMSRFKNANVASNGGSSANLQPANGVASSLMNNQHKMSSVSRDNLDERHGYSLLDNDNMLHLGNHINDQQQQQQKLSPAKPFLLSAMTQALGSMLANSPLESGSFSDGGIISRKMFTLNSNNDKSHHNLQNPSIGDHHDSILRRYHQASGPMEQRELSKLIPQSWREVVKRTMNSVQEHASTQWRSIEGQVANWVQDKLKTLPVAVGAASSGPASSAAGSSAAASAPVANIIASVSSTAMNILGLSGKNLPATNTSTSPIAASNPASSSESASAGEAQATTSVLKNKNDSINKSKQPIAKGALAGVANMIVNTLANRQNPSSQSVSKSRTPLSSGETSSSGNLVSQYPTLTGVQVEPSPSSSVDSAPSSIASGTASTVSNVSLMAS